MIVFKIIPPSVEQVKRRCTALCLLTMLLGCSPTHIGNYTRFEPNNQTSSSLTTDWTVSRETVFFLPINMSSYLDVASVGRELTLPATPWGSSVNIKLENRYFAASGMQCFRAKPVSENALPHAINLCRHKNGDWAATRSLVAEESVGISAASDVRS